MAYPYNGNRGGYTQPRGGFIQPASFHTWTLAKAIYFVTATLLMITGIQDFLDPGRRQIPTVNIKAITSIVSGFFMLYLFFTVINTPKYNRF
jgi:hypothetical protein